MTITLDQIRQAAQQIHSGIVQTPCIYSTKLSQLTNTRVALKFENLQFTGSFKDRGSLYKLLSLSTTQQQQGVVAMSAGNHAQAVAYHAQRLGIPAVIVMPQCTPSVKVERTQSFGAEIHLYGDTLDAAKTLAQQLAQERQLTLIHPYDDSFIIAGQGTVAIEMLKDCPDLDSIIVPIGGGGLISGIAIAAKQMRPSIHIIGVQTTRYPSMYQAIAGKQPCFGCSTIAEGIAVKTPGSLTLPIIQNLVDDIVLVEETEIEQAVRLLLEVEKTVVEGAGAVGLAALLKGPERFSGKTVGIVLSGGNIDLLILASILQRSLVRDQRLVRLQVNIRDTPGALAAVSQIIADTQANIVGVEHHRMFTGLPVQSAILEFSLLIRGHQHLEQILNRLKSTGHDAHSIPLDVDLATCQS
ncbi:threonine dehydratase, medium form [Leptolyngbya sp. PCC 7375]|nr:threonine dehydratase, medium form [Leptolyngbya sp. PCC 7375]